MPYSRGVMMLVGTFPFTKTFGACYWVHPSLPCPRQVVQTPPRVRARQLMGVNTASPRNGAGSVQRGPACPQPRCWGARRRSGPSSTLAPAAAATRPRPRRTCSPRWTPSAQAPRLSLSRRDGWGFRMSESKLATVPRASPVAERGFPLFW